jgi:catechol 2,3-dioxygenase-like lactoylglutathione lyase family enzyme
MKRIAIFLLLSTLATVMYAADAPKRPRILGVAHMAIYVSDLQKARTFYRDFLGYDEAFSIRRQDGSDRIAFIKINEDQYLELFSEDPKQDGHMNHVSVFTDSAENMRLYLASKGVKVPEKVGTGKVGNANFNIIDPDGHTLEIVEYKPESWTRQNTGKHLPDTRISTHMTHFGITVKDLDASMKFYGDILGFQETWRGSTSPKSLSWVNMKVPDGSDYIEFMLYARPLTIEQLGTKNHVCLVVPDVEKAAAALAPRAAKTGYTLPMEMKTGINGKRQVNLFDPDGTRIEVMEPNTFDGKLVPSSTAPAPKFDPNAPAESKRVKNTEDSKQTAPTAAAAAK